MPERILAGSAAIGLLGKLPAHGDFVRRGEDAALIGVVDAWLEREIGRIADPEAFEATLAQDPASGFVVEDAAGLVVVALIGSRDRIGRIYPLAAFARAGPIDDDVAAAWCVRAAETLATMRDTGGTADATVAALAAIPLGVAGDIASLAGDDAEWPSGEDFAGLFAVPESPHPPPAETNAG